MNRRVYLYLCFDSYARHVYIVLNGRATVECVSRAGVKTLVDHLLLLQLISGAEADQLLSELQTFTFPADGPDARRGIAEIFPFGCGG